MLSPALNGSSVFVHAVHSLLLTLWCCAFINILSILYSGKFSLSNNFVDFADRSQSAKILTTKILIPGSQAFASGPGSH